MKGRRRKVELQMEKQRCQDPGTNDTKPPNELMVKRDKERIALATFND